MGGALAETVPPPSSKLSRAPTSPECVNNCFLEGGWVAWLDGEARPVRPVGLRIR